jgi:transposase
MSQGQQASRYAQYVGIDVAAETAEVAVHRPGSSERHGFGIAQTEAGWQELTQRLLAGGQLAEQTLVVMEATGNYWMGLAASLHRAGFVVSVINPLQAHHFAQALLQRAKTDTVDAQTLAELAVRLQPTPWTPTPEVYEALLQRLTERESLLNLRQQVRNQLHALRHRTPVVAAVEARLLSLLDTFQGQVDTIDREIEQMLRHEPVWATSAALLLGIKGVGPITAAWLLVVTHNFSDGHSADQLAAYAGLVPYPHQSGTSIHRRELIGHAGQARLRRTLYMAALSASRYNPAIKVFYDRLRAKGKPMKVARCAAARKLLHIAWVVVTKQTPFDPAYEQHRLLALPTT